MSYKIVFYTTIACGAVLGVALVAACVLNAKNAWRGCRASCGPWPWRVDVAQALVLTAVVLPVAACLLDEWDVWHAEGWVSLTWGAWMARSPLIDALGTLHWGSAMGVMCARSGWCCVMVPARAPPTCPPPPAALRAVTEGAAKIWNDVVAMRVVSVLGAVLSTAAGLLAHRAARTASSASAKASACVFAAAVVFNLAAVLVWSEDLHDELLEGTGDTSFGSVKYGKSWLGALVGTIACFLAAIAMWVAAVRITRTTRPAAPLAAVGNSVTAPQMELAGTHRDAQPGEFHAL